MADAGIDVLSANTDGALCGVPVEKLEEFYRLCKKWEDQVLITECGIGELEYTEYSKYVMLNVNSYLAIKTDGTTKEKKDFLKDYLLEKNKSKKMVAVCLYEYYMYGKLPEQTMAEQTSIYDFTCAVKASKDYFYRQIDRKTGQVTDLRKLVRYYAGDPKGNLGAKLFKIKHEHSLKTGPKLSNVQKTSSKQVVFNTPFEVNQFKEYGIDYSWYAEKAYEIIGKIDPYYKQQRKEKLSCQQNLFS
jgi:hypothetical protein